MPCVLICARAIWIHVLVDTAIFCLGGKMCSLAVLVAAEKVFLLLFHARNENNIWHKRMSGGELGESIFPRGGIMFPRGKIVYVCMSRCGGETPRGNIHIRRILACMICLARWGSDFVSSMRGGRACARRPLRSGRRGRCRLRPRLASTARPGWAGGAAASSSRSSGGDLP